MSKTKKSTRVLSLLLCVLMLFSLFPTSAFAVEDGGETNAPLLGATQDAFKILKADGSVRGTYSSSSAAAAVVENGDTVQLLKDYSGTLSLAASYTLDLNGYTLTGQAVALIVDGVDYTVTVTSSADKGTIMSSAYYSNTNGAINASGGATVIVTDNVELQGEGGTKAFYGDGTSTLQVEGGTLSGSVTAVNANINGGKFNGTVTVTGTLNITGGEFVKSVGATNATVKITGGTFKDSLSVPDKTISGGRFKTANMPSADKLVGHATLKCTGTGGVFTPVQDTDGYFTVVPGKAFVANVIEGNYSNYFENIVDAIAARADGATVQLIKMDPEPEDTDTPNPATYDLDYDESLTVKPAEGSTKDMAK